MCATLYHAQTESQSSDTKGRQKQKLFLPCIPSLDPINAQVCECILNTATRGAIEGNSINWFSSMVSFL